MYFLFKATATTEIYTLSLHDALPISRQSSPHSRRIREDPWPAPAPRHRARDDVAEEERGGQGGRRLLKSLLLSHRPVRKPRSEEHTSELQSLAYLVCRLLLEKKK